MTTETIIDKKAHIKKMPRKMLPSISLKNFLSISNVYSYKTNHLIKEKMICISKEILTFVKKFSYIFNDNIEHIFMIY